MIIREYTKCIMQLLGQVAECVIVNKCASNPDINRVCINIARFKPNIYEEYSDISYEDYLAFSTSFKYVIYKDEKVVCIYSIIFLIIIQTILQKI